jgi:hypothetical protein
LSHQVIAKMDPLVLCLCCSLLQCPTMIQYQSPQRSRRVSLPQIACDLLNPLVTRHLDPGLTRYPKPLTFGIDLPEQVQRKIDIHALFGVVLPSEVRRDVFPTFGAFRNLFNSYAFTKGGFNQFLAHKFVSLLQLSSTP